MCFQRSQCYNEKLSTNANVNLLPPSDILAEAARLQEEFTEGGEIKALIEDYLEKLIPIDDIWDKFSKSDRRYFIQGGRIERNNEKVVGTVKRNVVCTPEIAFELFDIEQLNKDKMTLRDIKSIMDNLKGWHKESGRSTRMGPYGTQKNIYVRD